MGTKVHQLYLVCECLESLPYLNLVQTLTTVCEVAMISCPPTVYFEALEMALKVSLCADCSV